MGFVLLSKEEITVELYWECVLIPCLHPTHCFKNTNKERKEMFPKLFAFKLFYCAKLTGSKRC